MADNMRYWTGYWTRQFPNSSTKTYIPELLQFWSNDISTIPTLASTQQHRELSRYVPFTKRQEKSNMVIYLLIILASVMNKIVKIDINAVIKWNLLTNNLPINIWFRFFLKPLDFRANMSQRVES